MWKDLDDEVEKAYPKEKAPEIDVEKFKARKPGAEVLPPPKKGATKGAVKSLKPPKGPRKPAPMTVGRGGKPTLKPPAGPPPAKKQPKPRSTPPGTQKPQQQGKGRGTKLTQQEADLRRQLVNKYTQEFRNQGKRVPAALAFRKATREILARRKRKKN